MLLHGEHGTVPAREAQEGLSLSHGSRMTGLRQQTQSDLPHLREPPPEGPCGSSLGLVGTPGPGSWCHALHICFWTRPEGSLLRPSLGGVEVGGLCLHEQKASSRLDLSCEKLLLRVAALVPESEIRPQTWENPTGGLPGILAMSGHLAPTLPAVVHGPRDRDAWGGLCWQASPCTGQPSEALLLRGCTHPLAKSLYVKDCQRRENNSSRLLWFTRAGGASGTFLRHLGSSTGRHS